MASIGSTRTDDIVAHISRIPQQKRLQVKEVTLDMAENMAIKEAKKSGQRYEPVVFHNGDTRSSKKLMNTCFV